MKYCYLWGNIRHMSNSDYSKPRTNLYDLLPNVLKTKVNKSIFENVHNRYLTKTELVPAFGSVGKRNPGVLHDNRLPEPTVHRQAWQLQPLLYSKIATVEHISSYHDILQEAARLGIDLDRLPKWGNALKFNFAPPISIDKLVNYQDYYWYDPVNHNSSPQYITIRNNCAVADNRRLQLEAQLDRVMRNPTSTPEEIAAVQQDVDAATVQRDCVCSGGGIGWDRTGWDDSGGDWWLGLPTAPDNTPPNVGDTFVYYDTPSQMVKVWSATDNNWIDAVTPLGVFPWDAAETCVAQTDPWSQENRWIHKSAINDSLGGLVRRAEMPIIEYNSFIELNEWVYVTHQWKYRADDVSDWITVVETPTDLEMVVRHNITVVDLINNEIYVSGDLTSTFTPGFVFAINDPSTPTTEDTLWTVVVSGFDNINNRTAVQLVENVSPISTTFKIVPTSTTSLGDQWKGFFFHWSYVGATQPIPTNNQYANPNVVFSEALSTVSNSTMFVAPAPFLNGADVIRVYVDEIRQYGTYIEGWYDSITSTFVAGVGPDGIHSNAIEFFNAVSVPATVHIETSPAALSDINHAEVSVRVDTSTTFTPATITLINYRRVEQVKTETNQYPLFNIFNVDGTPAFKANSIFTFQEAANYPVDLRIGKRIITSNSGKEFYFEQHLIEEDNGRLYCYKDNSSVEINNPEGLQAIWRKGLNDEEYVPRYVNQYRLAEGDEYYDANNVLQTTHILPGVSEDYTTTGDWEVAEQLYYNVNHENRKKFKLTDLVAHFNTILQAQQPDATMSFLQDQTAIIGTLQEYNFGVGGSIKEFNDSYDTFLSAMYQDSNNPLSVTTFASSQYANNITYLQETFLAGAVDYLKRGTAFSELKYIWDQGAYIADDIITAFEFNDAYDFVFGDSTTYDKNNTVDGNGNKVGIKNWIATLPFLKLAAAVEPQKLVDPALGINKIRHHDGHITDINVDVRTISAITTQLLAETGGGTGTAFPTTNLVRGMYFKRSDTNTLYRYNVVDVAPSPPGIINPIGSFWLNTNTDTLYIRDGSITGWSVYAGSPEDAWKEINIADLVVDIVFEAEQRLYRAVPPFSEFAFDYAMLAPAGDTDEQQVFIDYLKAAYVDFVQKYQLNPFATDYNAVDAFTWNYGGIDSATIPAGRYPTVASGTAKPWGSRWTVIYKEIFGTSYPHIEPWVLQGYTKKPVWWDDEYKNMTGTRRWIPVMWSNIAAGIIPAGKTPPVGTVPQYTHFCVNIYNTTIDGYAPDELIPPYYSNDVTLKQQAILNDVSWLTTLTTKINPTDIVSNSSYGFGDQGPVEQMWRESVEFFYDIVKVAFKMQPVRFLHYTMGFEFYDVAGLQVEKTSGKVLSHKDMVFHGDLVNNEIYQSPGFGQWYTNFIRYGAYDINTSDFKTKWTEWDPTLAYQTASFINAKSLQLASKYFPVTKQDYAITTKKTPGSADYWIDSLFVTTNKIGAWRTFNNTKIPSGTGYDWEFRVETASPVGRDLHYYNVKNYQFTVDVNTNICTTAVGLPWNDSTFPETNTWVTGTAVFISSTVANPGGVNDERVYFIIKDGNNTFKLADSLTNAEEGIAIDITTTGLGDLFVGEVQQHFMVSNGTFVNVNWAHYKMDKRAPNTIQAPYIIRGVQNLINFVDGYAEYYKDQGFVFNDNEEITELDVDTGKPLSWSVEVDRLITRIYTGLGEVNQIVSYEQPGSGPYTTTGSASWITRQNNIAAYHEVNPFRNNIWFNNQVGVVSNIVSGPFDVVSAVPLIYDATGVGTTSDKVFIYREDSKCHITLASLSGSVYDGENDQPRPYTDSHMSGVHIFVDTYEHIVLFNNYTIDGNLLYDAFIGLNVGKLSVEFEKHTHQTFRPNVGGYFLNDNQLVQNMEYSIENMKYYYDTYIVNETADYLDYARALLGYEDPTYLDQLGVGSKSKFVFWKGMLQHKGSVNSIKAFINSRLFVDAKIDEFWAYKVAEYGNIDPPYYPEVVLKMDDVFKNELRLHFTTSEDDLEQTFKAITFDDETRWVNLPDLKAQLGVYRNQRYGWDLPVWDTSTGVEWDSAFPGVENLFFDAEYTDRTEITPTDEYVRLTTSCDGVSIIANNGTESLTLTGLNAIVPITLPSFTYLPGTNNLDVYFNGVKLEPTIGYTEINTTTIQLLVSGIGDVEIIKRPARLVERVNYERVNSYVIRLLPIASLAEFGNLTIYTINPAKQLQNAGRLVDIKSRSVVTDLPIWDPIHGHQYHNAINVVDLKNDDDMAIYSTTQDDVVDPTHIWNAAQVGKVWLDTKNMEYIPYHDTIIFPNINDRVTYWGKLVEWNDVNMYEWTESDVIPTQWDDLVTSQADDSTIPQNDKLTGTPRKVLYRRTRPTSNDDWGSWSAVSKPGYPSNPTMVVYGYIDNTTSYALDTSFTGTDGSKVGVYLNGIYKGDVIVANPLGNNPTIDISSIISVVNNYDTVTIIEQLHVPAEETSVTTLSTSTDLVEYIYNTPYSQVDTINNVGVVTSTKYYFWVKNKSNVTNNRVYSLNDAFAQLISPDVAYMFFQHFIPVTESMPNHYAQVIVRGIANRITADSRFKIRFTKDYSMRDEVSVKDSTFARKNVHQEWAIFRQQQESAIPRYLWNKVTEAATGHPLTKIDDTHYTMDTTALIPSLERTHYDQTHGTSTRIGLGDDQAFSDKTMTLNTILEEIQNPNYDLYPISRETFFATYSFDTDENTKAAMDYIYNSFPYAHINRIFFSVLYDALSLQAEYVDLFKTSTIALHGVRLFETADRVIDD